MSRVSAIGRLRLGPIVGHTDHNSTNIWIRVTDDPANYQLRIKNHSLVEFVSTEHGDREFVSTEHGDREFGTAIATATELRSDYKYTFDILRKRKVVSNSSGSFVTMPSPGSLNNIIFVSISCNTENVVGSWYHLYNFINSVKPRFLIMMGDQVYLDSESPNIWEKYLNSSKSRRRSAMAEKYQKEWSREPIKTILRNIPTYMIWDDGDIRNGWGCYAFDSPTLAKKYPSGKKMFEKCESYFVDARDVYYHFQACHNPININPTNRLSPEEDNRQALPYYFYCGRLAVLVTDSRGARDIWRDSNPILGNNQWSFINKFTDIISKEIDILAIVTPTPIVATDPDGFQQGSLGHRYDDVDLFKVGDEEKGFNILKKSGPWYDAFGTIVNRITGWSLGDYKIDQLGDVRSQWSHMLSRPEQEHLIRLAAKCTVINRNASNPRKIVFIGGDVHLGAILRIHTDNPEMTAECLVSSGINQSVGQGPPSVPLIFDEEFSVGEGINVRLEQIIAKSNFGITQIIFGGIAQIINNVAYDNISTYWKLKILH